MHVTRISRYITLYSVLYYPTALFRNRGRSWNVLPVDTAGHLYMISILSVMSESTGMIPNILVNIWS